MSIEFFFHSLLHLWSLVFKLFSMSKWEEVKLIISIVLPFFFLFIFFCLYIRIIVLEELFSFMHKKLVFSLAIVGHLLFHITDNFLFSLPSKGELALCSCKLVLHLTHIFFSDILYWSQGREINTLAKASVNTTLKHSRETWNSNAVFFIYILNLLDSELVKHIFTWLRVRVRHLDKLNLSSLGYLSTWVRRIIYWVLIRWETGFLKRCKWLRSCNWKFVALVQREWTAGACCLLIILSDRSLLLKLNSSINSSHAHSINTLVTSGIRSIYTK